MQLQRFLSTRRHQLATSFSSTSNYSTATNKYLCKHRSFEFATASTITNRGIHCQYAPLDTKVKFTPMLKYQQQRFQLFSTTKNAINTKNEIEIVDDITYATRKNLQEVEQEDPLAVVEKEEPIIGGADLLGTPNISSNNKKKILFDGHLPSGFDVLHIELPNGKSFPSKQSENNTQEDNADTTHYTSSVIAFEDIVYLWNIKSINEVTKESLSIVTLYEPKIELLFIGSSTPLSFRNVGKLQKYFKKFNISVEQLDISNAMATFNMLNSEDRNVAVALILDQDDESEES